MSRAALSRLGWLLLQAALAVGAWLPAAQGDLATSLAERPTYAVEPLNCVTSECHTDVVAYDVLHGPVSSKTCDACHRLTSAEAHTFELWREKEKLCTYCHEFNVGALPVLHEPVKTGECLGCHNPHGGTDRSFVREATMARTCGRCHESVVRGTDFQHEPVKKGECTGCHRPHASRYPMMLDAVGEKLCLSCHEKFADEMAHAAFKHEALEKGCTECHDPHGSNHPMEVTDALPELCLKCHEAIREKTEATYRHPAALGERACLTCHTPHGGNLARLMFDAPATICMGCHDKEIATEAGGVVAAMTEIADPATIKHTPIADGQCGGCHSIHGGENALLLLREYSTEFYEGFSEERYELCFGCHEEKMMDEKNAAAATEFRNGDLNLHYVHVAEGDQGRNCRVCHGVHTGKYPALIREGVRFGNWPMELSFERTPTGGTCATGCHPPFSYDRENPVTTNPVVLPPRPISRVPAADKWDPTVAQWCGRDIEGASLSVPDDDRPTVLLFLRADQVQSRRVVEMVSTAMPDAAPAQVVAVFCGDDADENARAFAAAEFENWPVVADGDGALSGPLGVEVWPATLVLRADGVVVAHEGGAPPALAVDLRAYLDFAAGAIDREGLMRRLAERGVVGGEPSTRAAWHLQMGRQLLRDGDAEAALAMLADGLRLAPDSPESQVETVRALLELKRAKEAADLLKRVPEAALPAWERSLLRGRAMAILGSWDEARRLATDALAAMPNSGAAHYFMGQVYEHDHEWEKAAAEYRAAAGSGAR